LIDTSKYGDVGPFHSCRGEFISSLASLCLFAIISRHHEYRSTNGLTIHQSEVINRSTQTSEMNGTSLNRHGTRATVRNLFGNMPVRVKQRALMQQSTSTLDKLWDELKLGIIALLLAWNEPVIVKIRDLRLNKSIILGENGQISRFRARDRDVRTLKPLPTKFSALLNQAGFLDSLNSSAWVPASVSSRNISIKGVIGLNPVPTRQLQYLSFGASPLERSDLFGSLYDCINGLFKASDFGVMLEQSHDDLDLGSVKVKSNSVRTPRKDAIFGRKGIEKWPSFYLRISVKEKTNLSPTEFAKEDIMSRIVEVLETLVEAWLLAQNFQPRKARKADSNDSPMKPKETSRSAVEPNSQNVYTTSERLLRSPFQPTNGWNSTISQLPIRPPIRNAVSDGIAPELLNKKKNETANDETILWTDPYTNNTHTLNARTGMALNPVIDDHCPTAQSSRRLTLNELKTNSSTSTPKPQWIEDITKTWINPTFANTQEPIRRVDSGNISFNQQSTPLTVFDKEDVKVANQFRDSISFGSSTRLAKSSLLDSRVIAQIDRQFILLSIPKDAEPDLLVAVDQHAADERCRVEQLFHDLCLPLQHNSAYQSNLGFKSSVEYVELTTPIQFRLPFAEIQHFENQASYFADWGILYDITSNPDLEKSNRGDLIVKTLPNVIAERVRLEPQILITFLREEMWKRTEDGSKPRNAMLFNEANSSIQADSTYWLRKIGQCPKGIVELLSSRACRSAIMFNDSLTIEECEGLIGRLANCAFPFQCAHGRPSMIPLIQVSSDDSAGESQELFTGAFRTWKEKEKFAPSEEEDLLIN
jgi:DNA mismatch repair protein MLH3